MIQKYPTVGDLPDAQTPITAHRDRGAHMGTRSKRRPWGRYLMWAAGIAAVILIAVYWLTGEPPKPRQPVAEKPRIATFQDNALKLDEQALAALGVATRRVEPQT